ncbi:MAG TPA: hypothetical protein VH639_06310 [Bryobacteraceae bacterium]
MRATYFLGLIGCASAQWLNYPTPGVPKTPSGLVNLGAPTLRTADGKPDFSGMWEAENINGGQNDLPVAPQFGNIGARIESGVPYQPWAAELRDARFAEHSKDDPSTYCLPHGVVRTWTYATLKKIVQVPGLIVLLDEHNASYGKYSPMTVHCPKTRTQHGTAIRRRRGRATLLLSKPLAFGMDSGWINAAVQ